jgi:hypothetical protein
MKLQRGAGYSYFLIVENSIFVKKGDGGRSKRETPLYLYLLLDSIGTLLKLINCY